MAENYTTGGIGGLTDSGCETVTASVSLTSRDVSMSNSEVEPVLMLIVNSSHCRMRVLLILNIARIVLLCILLCTARDILLVTAQHSLTNILLFYILYLLK